MAYLKTHQPCEDCGSSDALTINDNRSTYCYSCQKYTPPDKVRTLHKPETKKQVNAKLLTGSYSAIINRRIKKETAQKYNALVDGDNVVFGYYGEGTEPVASKTRYPDKRFLIGGDWNKAKMFGQQLFPAGGKYITITEGELDALAVYEMSGRQWDVVSLRSGASNAAKEVKEQLEWLESYENVVLCFDNDKAGEAAVDQVKDLFSPNKLKIVKLPLKDAGDMLMANRVKDFTQAWWNAKVYRPDGIVAGTDTWENLVEKRNVKSVPYPWEGLNHITRGHRPYELVTITSGSGMGKSQFIREIEYDLLKRCEGNIGVLALEEDLSRTTLGIMSVAANRPLHLEEDTHVDDLRPFWESTMGTGRYYLFDHWGSTSADNLLGRVRYMAKALDCRYVILDHLSIVVSSQESGDERKAIDEIMTKLRTLVAETGICLFLVSHLRRSQGRAHEDGAQISLGELRGSQAIAQLSDIVIGMERDQQHENEDIRNTTTVRVLKNRYTGETGPACWLAYDRTTGRLTEVPNPNVGDDF